MLAGSLARRLIAPVATRAPPQACIAAVLELHLRRRFLSVQPESLESSFWDDVAEMPSLRLKYMAE